MFLFNSRQMTHRFTYSKNSLHPSPGQSSMDWIEAGNDIAYRDNLFENVDNIVGPLPDL